MKQLTILFLLLSLNSFSQFCPDEGSATTARLKSLNVLKNRPIIQGQIDSTVTLNSILADGVDTDRFNDSEYICITGWCILAKLGGPESCNCKTADKQKQDVHFVIAKDSNETSQDSCMIAEATAKFRQNNSINPSDFVGHKLYICGWIFRDDEHVRNSINDAKTGTKDTFRKTPWEIHPITVLAIIK